MIAYLDRRVTTKLTRAPSKETPTYLGSIEFLSRMFEKVTEEYMKQKYRMSKTRRLWWKDVEIHPLALREESVADEYKRREDFNPKQSLYQAKQKTQRSRRGAERFTLISKRFLRQEK